MHGTYQTVPDLWPSSLPLYTLHTRVIYLWPKSLALYGIYQRLPDLCPSPLPLLMVHTRKYLTSDSALYRYTVYTREYLTSDPARYRYARYIPDSTWPLTQPVTVIHGTYQTVPDLWPSPLPLYTVHTRQYLTSDPARYRYARYITDSTWPLFQPVTVIHGTYQTVPDLWPSPLPLCTVHTRQYPTSDPARYRYARYIPDSTWPLTLLVTVMHGTYQTVPDLWLSPLPLCTVHTR